MRCLAFGTVLIFVFVVPWENLIIIPGVGTVAKIVGIMAIVIGTLTILMREKLRWHPFHIMGLAFTLWAWASLSWSIDLQATIARVITYTGLWLISVAVYQFADTEARCRRFMWAYVLGACVAALVTIENYLQGTQVVYHRYAASGFDPNDLSFYLNFAIPMAWYLSKLKGQSSVARLSAWGLIPVVVFAVLLTGSRSGAFGCGLALLYVIFSSFRLNLKWCLAGVGLAIVFAIIVAHFVPSATYARLSTIPVEVFHGTLNERIIIWQAGVRVFTESPVCGVGSGAFRYAVAPLLGDELAPHNVFLAVAVESGLIGVVLWLGLMAMAFKGMFYLPLVKCGMWMTILGILLLAFLSLNFEWRKVSWLIMTLAAAHAKITSIVLPNEEAGSS